MAIPDPRSLQLEEGVWYEVAGAAGQSAMSVAFVEFMRWQD